MMCLHDAETVIGIYLEINEELGSQIKMDFDEAGHRSLSKGTSEEK